MISLFLPIKKNSKRIKNKNFKKLGKYSLGLSEIKICQLLKVSRILKKKKIKSEIIISTDSKILKKKFRKISYIKFFDRPKRLTRDDCLDELVKEVPKLCSYKYILWTHVTSPLFSSNEYLKFLKRFLSQKKFKSAFSASLISSFFMNSNNKWVSHNIKKKKWPRTQDLKKFYLVNNAAFINSKKNYENFSDRLDKKPLPIITQKYLDLDIDDEDDLIYLKNYLKKEKKIII